MNEQHYQYPNYQNQPVLDKDQLPRPNDRHLRLETPGYQHTIGNEFELDPHEGDLNFVAYDSNMTTLLELERAELASLRSQLREQLDFMREQNRDYATAVQDWVLAEIDQRAEARGQEYDQEDFRGMKETVDILISLTGQLEQDQEDSQLIELADTWRQEITVDMDLWAADIEIKRIEAEFNNLEASMVEYDKMAENAALADQMASRAVRGSQLNLVA